MKLAKLREFRDLVFTPQSAPAESTLRRQIETGQIPGGQKVGGLYYIDLDEYSRATNLRAHLAAQQAELARNPLLADLL